MKLVLKILFFCAYMFKKIPYFPKLYFRDDQVYLFLGLYLHICIFYQLPFFDTLKIILDFFYVLFQNLE